jgi:Spy/CpxP family protein refolding chaperone
MKTTYKFILAIAIGFHLVCGAAFAAPPGGCGGYGGHHGHYGAGGKGGSYRLDNLKIYLQLRPEQEQAWQGFASAMDAHHQAMRGHRRGSGEKDNTAVEHFNDRIRFMEARLADMKNLAKAGEALYAALTPEQKAVMDQFFSHRRGGGKSGKKTD